MIQTRAAIKPVQQPLRGLFRVLHGTASGNAA